MLCRFLALPGLLQGACLLLLSGLVAVMWGYFTLSTVHSIVGVLLLGGGYLLATLDLCFRKTRRYGSSNFSTAFVIAHLFAILLAPLLLLLGGFTIVLSILFEGSSESQVVRTVHFLALLLVYGVVYGTLQGALLRPQLPWGKES